MKAKDLMQGDYITFKDALKDGIVVPVKIVGLGYVGRGVGDEALVEINGDKSCDIIEINDECVGIPLTSEILEKIGFKKFKSPMGREYYEIPMDKDYIRFDTDFAGRIQGPNGNFEYKNIMFVHELQHAFRMLGIEKEIEL